jgi:hypothetical protein
MRKAMRRLGLNEVGRIALVLGIALLFAACGGSPVPPTSSSASASPSPQASPLTAFEQDLQFIRNGQFTYIWVFSRKDGKPLDREDGTFLRTNAPQVVDWVTTDEGRKVIAGTNFNLEEGNLEALKKRFNAEDYTGK